MKTRKLWFMGIAAAAISLSAACAATGPRIEIDSGMIQGVHDSSGVSSWLDIPYAAAPAGALRWREPQPVESWAGVRNTTSFGPFCEQPSVPFPGAKLSEDCLSLNVWTPPGARSGARLPVLVWLHGAGFNTGGGSQARFDGTSLARKGLVVVTINYRLGVMASLALPELVAESPHHTAGALLHLDQLAALHWVQRNIAQFGGNPANVTLMGQSSGSIDVSILQASPLAHGLFARAMAISGAGLLPTGAWPVPTLESGFALGENFEHSVGAASLADLRAMPIDQLMAKAPFYLPIGVDGYVLPQSPAAIFTAGKQNDVPLFILYTRDEGFSSIAKVQTLGEYHDALVRLFGTDAAKIAALYPADTDADARRQAVRIANDGEFGKQMLNWARMQSATGHAPVYLGHFEYGAAAPHGADVRYWLGTLSVSPTAGQAPPATDADRALSAQMQELLVSFARTGRPMAPGFAAPAYRAADEEMTVIDSKLHVAPVPAGAAWFLAHPEDPVGIGERGFAMMTRAQAATLGKSTTTKH